MISNIEKIFNEIFGEDFSEVFTSNFNKLSEELKNENDCDKSYYNKVCDKYENGKRVSHDEVEIKNGKVLKDIHESMKIENKNDENSKGTCCNSQKCVKGENASNTSSVSDDVETYKKKICKLFKRIEKLNEENEEKEQKIFECEKIIKEQNNLINLLENKLNNVRNVLK